MTFQRKGASFSSAVLLILLLAACQRPGERAVGFGLLSMSPGEAGPAGNSGGDSSGSAGVGSVAASDSESGASATTDTTPADQPPITLGSYPWTRLIGVAKSADGKVTTFKGRALDDIGDREDVPSPVRGGKVTIRGVDYPISIDNQLQGKFSFQVPSSILTSEKERNGRFREGVVVPLLKGPYSRHGKLVDNWVFEWCD